MGRKVPPGVDSPDFFVLDMGLPLQACYHNACKNRFISARARRPQEVNMSTNRKALKIVSLLQLLAALGAAALGAIALFGADLAEAEAGVLGVLVVYADGVLYVACAVLTLFCAFMGIHGANQPSRLGSHRLIAVLVVLLSIGTGVFAGLGQEIPVMAVVVGVLALAAAVLDGFVRKEADL